MEIATLYSLILAQAETDVTWWQQALIALAGTAGTAVLGALAWAMRRLFDWLSEKTKLEFLSRVDDLALDVVTELWNSEVRHLKAAAADGKWTSGEKKKIAKLAVTTLKSYLGERGMKKLAWVVTGDGSTIHKLLRSKIEKAVTTAKNAGKAARGGAPSGTRP